MFAVFRVHTLLRVKSFHDVFNTSLTNTPSDVVSPEREWGKPAHTFPNIIKRASKYVRHDVVITVLTPVKTKNEAFHPAFGKQFLYFPKLYWSGHTLLLFIGNSADF